MKFWKAELRATVKNLPRHSVFWMGEPKELRLTVDSMFPKSLSNQGLSKVLPKSRWDKIRIPIYFDYDHKCAICEGEPILGKLHCHEVWSYDERTRTQKLDEFIALCDLCHRVKHGVWLKQLWDGKQVKHPNLAKDLRMHARNRECAAFCRRGILKSPDKFRNVLDPSDGRAKQKFIASLEKQSKAIMPCEHFLKINNCSFKTAEMHFVKAAEEWGERSRHEWRVDYGEYKSYVRKPNRSRT